MIECKCGGERCKTRLYFGGSTESPTIEVDDTDHKHIAVYLDANSLIKIIREARELLLNMTHENKDY